MSQLHFTFIINLFSHPTKINRTTNKLCQVKSTRTHITTTPAPGRGHNSYYLAYSSQPSNSSWSTRTHQSQSHTHSLATRLGLCLVESTAVDRPSTGRSTGQFDQDLKNSTGRSTSINFFAKILSQKFENFHKFD